jgi:hypothetical protein
MSTSQIDTLWCKNWHHCVDRRARRGGRTSSFAERCCSACNATANRRRSSVTSRPKGELALRSRGMCVRMQRAPVPLAVRGRVVCAQAHFAQPMAAAAARDVLCTSARGCSGARPGARHGRPCKCECCVGGGGLSAPTCLSAASYARLSRLSAHRCGVSLHARGYAVGRAVRRSAALPDAILDGPVGAAHEQLCDRIGRASVRGPVQRRVPARQTGGHSAAAPPMPKRKRRTRSGSGRSRRRRMRSVIGRFADCRGAPQSAARCCLCCARRGRGEGVGPTGSPEPPVPETKQQAGPEGRLRRFW